MAWLRRLVERRAAMKLATLKSEKRDGAREASAAGKRKSGFLKIG